MFDWKKLEDTNSVIDEICIGLEELDLNDTLTVISSVIFELGYSFSSIKQRTNEMLAAEYEDNLFRAEGLHDETDPSEQQDMDS